MNASQQTPVPSNCILSCILAAVCLARVAKSWNRVDAMGLLAAALLGWLGASAFANASGRVTLNGASTEWVSWPTLLWLLMLMVVFAVRACDVRQGDCPTSQSSD